jgi:tetratricopeptide (TPR) repeat protein
MDQAYGGLLDLLKDAKKYDAALRVCREILELKPPVDKPRIVLLAVKTKDGEDDFEEFEKYNSAVFLFATARREEVRILAAQGKADKALELVDKVLKDDNSWQNKQLKADVLREAGKTSDAVDVYRDILEEVRASKDLKPKAQGVLEDHFRHVLSNLYADLHQVDKAAEQLKILMEKNPEDPGPPNDLGYIWADHDKNLAEAEKLVRKALELDKKRREAKKQKGESGAYLDSLGWVLYKQKRYKEAKEVMLRAVKDQDAQDIVIYEHLGDVHLALGERTAAIAAWQKALKLAGTGRRDAERRVEVERKIEQAKGVGSR